MRGNQMQRHRLGAKASSGGAPIHYYNRGDLRVPKGAADRGGCAGAVSPHHSRLTHHEQRTYSDRDVAPGEELPPNHRLGRRRRNDGRGGRRPRSWPITSHNRLRWSSLPGCGRCPLCKELRERLGMAQTGFTVAGRACALTPARDRPRVRAGKAGARGLS
jgi:hypothetical protein